MNSQSLAYDLKRFEDRPQQIKASGKKNISVSKNKESVLSVQLIVTFLIVFATLAAILLSYAQLTEVSSQVSGLKKELQTAQETSKRLSLETEKITSLSAVENYARNQLGMIEIQPYQIEYISMNNSDKAVILKDKGTPVKSIYSSISQTFNAVLEYLD